MSQPADEPLLDRWATYVADRLTADALAAAVLPALIGRLTAALPRAHPDDVVTAAEDAVLALLKRPEGYDPGKLPLLSFLTFVARRDYLNQTASEGRHRRGRIPWDCVELDAAGRNEETDDDVPSFDDPRLQAAVASLADPERQVLDLLRAGERRTAAFAAVLGVGDAPAAEQEAAVKRAKDRIKVRLRRAVGGSDA